jgi:hypothetical protein
MRFLLLFHLTLVSIGIGVSPPVRADETVAKKYEALLAEYEEDGGIRIYAKRFLAFAEENIADPVSFDALFWVVDNVPGRKETERAIELLDQKFVTSKKMGIACKEIAKSRTHGAEQILRHTLDKNKDKATQARACLYLALLLDREATIVEQLAAEPEAAPRLMQYFGAEYGAHLRSLKTSELAKEREKVYVALSESFADVEIEDQKLGDFAEHALFGLRNLSVGCVAPEIRGPGINAKELKLSDYRGKVVMLYFWGHW